MLKNQIDIYFPDFHLAHFIPLSICIERKTNSYVQNIDWHVKTYIYDTWL